MEGQNHLPGPERSGQQSCQEVLQSGRNQSKGGLEAGVRAEPTVRAPWLTQTHGSALGALRKGGLRSGEQGETGTCGFRISAGAFWTGSQRAGMGLSKGKSDKHPLLAFSKERIWPGNGGRTENTLRGFSPKVRANRAAGRVDDGHFR